MASGGDGGAWTLGVGGPDGGNGLGRDVTFTARDMAELDAAMYRCDRAVGNLRERRLTRRDANELIGAVLSLTNRLRLIRNTRLLYRGEQ